MEQQETTTRIRLSREAVRKLKSLTKQNNCCERAIVDWVIRHHTWWIESLYALPKKPWSSLYKTQLRKHRQRVNKVKASIAGSKRVGVSLGRSAKETLDHIKRETVLPFGAILSLALVNLDYSKEMWEISGKAYVREACFEELLQQRKRIAREVEAMEELWEKVIVMSWREDTTLGYRKLLAFFTAFHELGEYPCRCQQRLRLS